MIKSLEDVELYVILSPREDMDYLKMAEEAILGGADMVQLRIKDWMDRKIIEIGEKLREITIKYKVPLVVNDRLDIAVAIGADGVHIGQEDMAIPLARRLLRWELAGATIYQGKEKKVGQKGKRISKRHFVTRFIGVSTHSLKEAVKAERDGADYVSIGPIFQTLSKPDLKPIGLSPIHQVKEKVKIPFFAIGGIDQKNVGEVVRAGAEKVAVIHAVIDAEDVRKACEEMKKKIKEAKG